MFSNKEILVVDLTAFATHILKCLRKFELLSFKLTSAPGLAGASTDASEGSSTGRSGIPRPHLATLFKGTVYISKTFPGFIFFSFRLSLCPKFMKGQIHFHFVKGTI